MAISDIGSTDDTSLLCHTNAPPSGGNSGGHWFTPEGTAVPFSHENDPDGTAAVPGVRRNRGSMVVRLYRDTATGTPAEGIYYCQINDTLQTVYVAIALSNGTGLHRHQHAIHMHLCWLPNWQVYILV